MILWLDHLIFGNGYGLASPHCNQRFYWLNDQLYTFSPGLGAQFQSFQWRHPKPGERRQLAGHEVVAFNSSRMWCRVRVSWALTGLPDGCNYKMEKIREVEHRLRNGDIY